MEKHAGDLDMTWTNEQRSHQTSGRMSNVVIKPVTDGHLPKRLNTSKLPSLDPRLWIYHSKYDIHVYWLDFIWHSGSNPVLFRGRSNVGCLPGGNSRSHVDNQQNQFSLASQQNSIFLVYSIPTRWRHKLAAAFPTWSQFDFFVAVQIIEEDVAEIDVVLDRKLSIKSTCALFKENFSFQTECAHHIHVPVHVHVSCVVNSKKLIY